MAKLLLHKDRLEIKLSASERAMSRRSENITIERSAIRSATITEDPWIWVRGVRAPGTSIPLTVAIGRWKFHGGDDFLLLRGRKPAVVIDLDGGEFARVIVSTDHTASLIEALALDARPRRRRKAEPATEEVRMRQVAPRRVEATRASASDIAALAEYGLEPERHGLVSGLRAARANRATDTGEHEQVRGLRRLLPFGRHGDEADEPVDVVDSAAEAEPAPAEESPSDSPRTAAKKPSAKKTDAKPAATTPAPKKTSAKPAATTPAAKKAAESGSEPAQTKPTAKKTAAKTAAATQPDAKKPAASASEEPAMPTSAKKPAAKKSTGSSPSAAKTSATTKPAAKTPAAKKTTGSASEPAATKPAAKKPTMTGSASAAKKPAATTSTGSTAKDTAAKPARSAAEDTAAKPARSAAEDTAAKPAATKPTTGSARKPAPSTSDEGPAATS